MINRRVLVLAAGLGAGMAGVAQAEDRPVDWGGSYAGFNGGYAFGSASSDGGASNGPSGSFWNPLDVPVVAATARRDISPEGFNAGIEGGHNFQMGHWVPGIDLGFGYFHTQDSFTSDHIYATNHAETVHLAANLDTDWLLTVRPKIGYAFDRYLVDVSAGLAVTQMTIRQSFADPANSQFESASKTMVVPGLALGAGLHYAITDAWSFKGEYLFTHFSSPQVVGNLHSAAGVVNNSQVNQAYAENEHVFRVGIDYRF